MARTISPFFLLLCKIHKDGRSNKLVDFFKKKVLFLTNTKNHLSGFVMSKRVCVSNILVADHAS